MKLRGILENALAGLRRQRSVFCGMTGNVDIVLSIRDDMFLAAQQRFGSDPAASDEPPSPNISGTVEALDYAAWFMARGSGGEADIPSIRPLEPLIGMFPNFRAVGGTGAQAANWLAHAGFKNTVLYLPYFDEAFREVLHLDGMEIIDNNDGYADVMAADPTFSEVHCIFDYRQNARLRYGRREAGAPRHDRVILDGDRCNSLLRISERFHNRVCSRHDESSLLVTGYNLCRSMDNFRDFVEQSARLMRDYRLSNRDSGFIHIEDCFQWDNAPERRNTVAEKIWPLADSVGMNEAEFGELCAFFNLDESNPDAALLALADKSGLKRVCLHTATHCRAVTRYPRERELSAIGLAILFSSARAYYGTFVDVDGLVRLVEETAGISENAVAGDSVPLGGGYASVVVPTLSGMPIRSSIGLGDAFTAGLLAYL